MTNVKLWQGQAVFLQMSHIRCCMWSPEQQRSQLPTFLQRWRTPIVNLSSVRASNLLSAQSSQSSAEMCWRCWTPYWLILKSVRVWGSHTGLSPWKKSLPGSEQSTEIALCSPGLLGHNTAVRTHALSCQSHHCTFFSIRISTTKYCRPCVVLSSVLPGCEKINNQHLLIKGLQFAVNCWHTQVFPCLYSVTRVNYQRKVWFGAGIRLRSWRCSDTSCPSPGRCWHTPHLSVQLGLGGCNELRQHVLCVLQHFFIFLSLGKSITKHQIHFDFLLLQYRRQYRRIDWRRYDCMEGKISRHLLLHKCKK